MGQFEKILQFDIFMRKTARKSRRREETQPQEELLTAREQLLLAQPPPRPTPFNTSMNLTLSQEQEQELPNNQIDRLSAMVNQLIAKNKVSARNAFDIPLIHLHETRDFQKTQGDNAWKKLSSTLQNDYKIYGYRVDATHDWTHRMLEAIIRQDKKEGREEGREGDRRDREREREELMPQLLGNEDDILGQQLERNYRSINILQVETFFNFNPLLEQTRRLFDHNELRGLMLNNLTLGPDYALRIASRHTEHPLPPAPQQAMPADLPEEPVMLGENIFRRISEVCVVHSLLEDGGEVKRESNQMEEIWVDFGVAAGVRRSQRISREVVQLDADELTQSKEEGKVEGKEQRIEEGKVEGMQVVKAVVGNEIVEEKSLGDEDCIIISVIPPKQVEKQTEVKQEAVDPHPVNNPEQLPPANISQIIPQMPNPSLTFDNISALIPNPPPQPHPKPHPQPKLISSIITLKSMLLSNSTDLILREIKAHEPEQPQPDLVQRWKANHPKPKKPKQPKPPTPPLEIDFLSGPTPNKYRKTIISLDKLKRKEIKQMLKNLQQPYRDRNRVSEPRGRIDYKVTTWLKEQLAQQKKIQPTLGDSGSQGNVTSGEGIIDVDRTTLRGVSSIREAKDKIRKIIAGVELEISFKNIYESFTLEEGFISPALCFLTVLHLTNEHGYSLAQNDQFDFLLHKQIIT